MSKVMTNLLRYPVRVSKMPETFYSRIFGSVTMTRPVRSVGYSVGRHDFIFRYEFVVLYVKQLVFKKLFFFFPFLSEWQSLFYQSLSS